MDLDQPEVGLALVVGIAIGYFIRAAISAARRREARLRHERALAVEAARRQVTPVLEEASRSSAS
jgi:hypothetical protein